MDTTRAERRLEVILALAERWLPGDQLADMRALVTAGEPGIALENFCTQLEEFDVVVPDEVIDELTDLAEGLGVELSTWMRPHT